MSKKNNYSLKRMIISEEVSRAKKQRTDKFAQSTSSERSITTDNLQDDFLENMLNNIDQQNLR